MFEVDSAIEMQALGERFGRLLHGGELIELVGDVGAGKTTFVRGVAKGMSIDETIQSPSFTISRVYDVPDDRRLVHYDFYRLSDPGIMASELSEALGEADTTVIIEWADSVARVLPVDRLTVTIVSPDPTRRQLTCKAGGQRSRELLGGLT